LSSCHFFLFSRPVSPRDIPSFPTRRSSDLAQVGRYRQRRIHRVEPLAFGDEVLSPAEHAADRGAHLERGMLRLHDPSDRSALHGDRKSTRLNSSHVSISYAVFCLKKKKKKL